jgi:nucleoside-diphosphate-sugar epimerase
VKQGVLVTGGAGYVGNRLVPRLLESGYRVVVYDACFFKRDTLPLNNPNLTLVQGDIRDINKFSSAVKGVDTVLHLACISNDPSFELNEALSKSINYDCFEPIVTAAKAAGVSRFVYCSSSSAYGVSDLPEVTEESPLVPLTLYNKYKGLCEPLLLKHKSPDFITTVIRPATLCGISPRMRFDLTVNILTCHAFKKGVITVLGGSQRRPNLHIEDMCDAYLLLMKSDPALIQGETFNIGNQNLAIYDIAIQVKETIEKAFPDKRPIKIQTQASQDTRSYHINSDKIARVLQFRPKRNIQDAIMDICLAFERGEFADALTNDWYYNVRYLKSEAIA